MSQIASPCGCIVAPCPSSGILRSIMRCQEHSRARRNPATLGKAYYVENGSLNGPHLDELLEALGPFPAARGNRQALEIGCGCSPYAGAIKAAGWQYLGIDCSWWAAIWTADSWGVQTIARPLEAITSYQPCGLILAAHIIEHLDDAPGELCKLARALLPTGELWIVVPDDTDLCNPDHTYFFTELSLEQAIRSAGLEVVTMRSYRRIERENFIYCRALKK